MSQSRSDSAKVAGATYTRAGQGYFEKRHAEAVAPASGACGASRVAAVISGDFSGLELRHRLRRLRRDADRLRHPRGHVLRHDLLDRRDGGRDAAHRRRVLVRPLGDGPLGRARHRRSPRRSSTSRRPRSSCTSRPPTRTRSRASCSSFSMPTWVWWIILYVVFIALNSRGRGDLVHVRDRRRRSSRSASSWSSRLMAAVLGRVRLGQAVGHRARPGQTEFLPHGVLPILFALPFAMWFFLGIEELPLAAEESTTRCATSRRPASGPAAR